MRAVVNLCVLDCCGAVLCRTVLHGPAGGSASGYSVSLNAATLISKAKAATKTGYLTEELPPPTGYVAGKHPIRPGGWDVCLPAGWGGQQEHTELCTQYGSNVLLVVSDRPRLLQDNVGTSFVRKESKAALPVLVVLACPNTSQVPACLPHYCLPACRPAQLQAVHPVHPVWLQQTLCLEPPRCGACTGTDS